MEIPVDACDLLNNPLKKIKNSRHKSWEIGDNKFQLPSTSGK